jgi:predicted porin
VEDSYGELVLAASYNFGQWRVDTSGALLEYMSHSEFSQSIFSLGGARGFTFGNWYFEVGASGAQLSLGGDVFERDTAASALVSRMFYDGSQLRAQFRSSRVDGKSDFIGLTGDRQEYGLYYDRSWRSWTFGVHTRAERNDTQDPIFASRWTQFGVDARYAWSPMWGFAAYAALRSISHPQQSETLAAWDDKRATLQLGVTRALWKQTQIFLRVEHERNDSPVAGYDYDRNWIAASIENWR